MAPLTCGAHCRHRCRQWRLAHFPEPLAHPCKPACPQTYCCEAYNILRKSANLLLNLLHLMAGASIPDIQSDPEKAMLKLQVAAAVLACGCCCDTPRGWMCRSACSCCCAGAHAAGKWQDQMRASMVPPTVLRRSPWQEKLRPELRDEEAALWMTQVCGRLG